jgi:hypothetical protein
VVICSSSAEDEVVMTTPDALPADLAEAHAVILAERAGRLAAEAEAALAKQTKRVLDLEIERLKLEIARLRRQRFGPSVRAQRPVGAAGAGADRAAGDGCPG